MVARAGGKRNASNCRRYRSRELTSPVRVRRCLTLTVLGLPLSRDCQPWIRTGIKVECLSVVTPGSARPGLGFRCKNAAAGGGDRQGKTHLFVWEDPMKDQLTPLQQQTVDNILKLQEELGRRPCKNDLPPALLSDVIRSFRKWCYALEAAGLHTPSQTTLARRRRRNAKRHRRQKPEE